MISIKKEEFRPVLLTFSKKNSDVQKSNGKEHQSEPENIEKPLKNTKNNEQVLTGV